MFRPTNVKIFEPTNPEYNLVHSINSELNEAVSPKLMVWMIDLADAAANQDEIDNVYGENSAIDKTKNISKNIKYDGPYEFFGNVQVNEIIQEMSRLGVEQVEEIDIFVDLMDFTTRMKGSQPKPGDIIRISYIEMEDKATNQTHYRHVFYEIGTILPCDLYNFKYINLHIYAEQASLGNVPKTIINYDELDGKKPYDQPSAPWETEPVAPVVPTEKDFNY